MRVGVVGNPRYPDLPAVLGRLVASAPASGVTLAFEPRLAGTVGAAFRPLEPEAPLDAMLTFGGDGTLLYGARLTAHADVPLLGVNMGRVGYLTSATVEDVPRLCSILARRQYTLERRQALQARLVGADGAVLLEHRALNDAVVHKGGVARVVAFDVLIDGENAGPYSADGLIVATPTGSTAYSISAGGPIVMPGVEAMVVTPICAHTLAVRPLVVQATAAIVVRPLAEGEDDLLVSVDGQVARPLRPGDRLEVRRAERWVPLVRLDGDGFLGLLRRKLHWGDLQERERKR